MTEGVVGFRIFANFNPADLTVRAWALQHVAKFDFGGWRFDNLGHKQGVCFVGLFQWDGRGV